MHQRKPTDRTAVVVYDQQTGLIRQHVRGKFADMHRHHTAFPDHHFLEVTGQDVDPHKHMVDVKSGRIVERTVPTLADRRRKENELRRAHEAVGPKADDVLDSLVLAGTGDVNAKAELKAIAKTRTAAADQLAQRLAAVEKAETLQQLAAISW